MLYYVLFDVLKFTSTVRRANHDIDAVMDAQRIHPLFIELSFFSSPPVLSRHELHQLIKAALGSSSLEGIRSD